VLTTDHTVLLATHTLIHEWNEPPCLWSPAAAHQRTLVRTHDSRRQAIQQSPARRKRIVI